MLQGSIGGGVIDAIGGGGVIDVIHLIQDTERLQAVVNRAINFRVNKGQEFHE